ncbi:MAG: transferase [Rickettsiales bacterium]|nr:transferase [Rickettsiales bacterium]
MKRFSSHGSGDFAREDFRSLGQNVIFEAGCLVFHPENIELGDNIYIGHQAILKGYYKGLMSIGNDVWIGQQCFLHGAGGLRIGNGVGIGPGVRILTSAHDQPAADQIIMEAPIRFQPVHIGDGSDLGAGATILPGVRIGSYVQVGAGALVNRDLPDNSVAAGVPARVLRIREATTA